MPTKKSNNDDDKKKPVKKSSKDEKASNKEDDKKKSVKKSTKEEKTSNKEDDKKKSVKKSTKKPESIVKQSTKKTSVFEKKKESSSSKKENSDSSDESESDQDNSIFTASENSGNDYENTETKLSEFFTEDVDSETNDETEFTDIKSDTIDSIDPKEIIYNSLLLHQNSNKDNSFDSINKIVDNSERLTNPRMTKYEMVRIIGERTKQFKMGAKPLIKNTDDLTYEEKAVLELKKNMTPFKIKRPLPNNTYEIWEMSELNKDHLEF